MGTLLIGGKLFVEKPGPGWVLGGVPKRIKGRPNCLILTRKADALSPRIQAGIGRVFLNIRISDLNGCTASLTHARIVSLSAAVPTRVDPRRGSTQNTRTNEDLEEIEFVFQKLTVENVSSETAATADWASTWPP